MYSRRVESLLSLSTYSFLKNLPRHSQDIEAVKTLPFYVKNEILKKFTSSLVYSRKVDFGVVFDALINTETTEINLYDNIDNYVLNRIQICRNLRKLCLNNIHTDGVTTISLINMFRYLTKLQYLEIRQCDNITDVVLQYISDRCQLLQGICLAGCKHITDKGMKYLAQLESLIAIDLFETEISDEGVCALVSGRSADNFKELKIKCPNVTDFSLNLICSNCPNLELLTFYNKKEGNFMSPIDTFEEYPLKNLKQLTFVVQW